MAPIHAFEGADVRVVAIVRVVEMQPPRHANGGRSHLRPEGVSRRLRTSATRLTSAESGGELDAG